MNWTHGENCPLTLAAQGRWWSTSMPSCNCGAVSGIKTTNTSQSTTLDLTTLEKIRAEVVRLETGVYGKGDLLHYLNTEIAKATKASR